MKIGLVTNGIKQNQLLVLLLMEMVAVKVLKIELLLSKIIGILRDN